MRYLTILCLSGMIGVSYAQNKTRESLDPTVTEIWEPRVPKVTSGPNAGEAPSDAVVLFNGKDLSEWTSADGSEAKWDLKDGAMTVKKGTGEIKTKKTFGDIQLHIEWRTDRKSVV